MSVLAYSVLALVTLGAVNSENGTAEWCALEPGGAGLWGALLEEWATEPHTDRQGRIMALPPAQGYYVTDRVDRPPPPPHGSAPPPYGPPQPQAPPYQVPYQYDEWQASPPPPPDHSKIVNRPSNPYKDKFKPNYQSPPPQQQIPTHGPPSPHRGPGLAGAPSPHRGPAGLAGAPGSPSGAGAVDRVDEPPRKQVSETDLYLLSAIEKLVYRVDLMEKRLRKMEENMHYLVAGTENKPEPCVESFTRVGPSCYHWAETAVDWKSANLQCRKLRANLLELESEREHRQLLAAMLADKRIRGMDVWTGGLNPGLLWIWAHSARPVLANATAPAPGGSNATLTIVGEGRCLALVHDPARNTYLYRGQDCALRHRFVCEKEEDKSTLSNEIERVARALRARAPGGGAGAGGARRRGRDMWSADNPPTA